MEPAKANIVYHPTCSSCGVYLKSLDYKECPSCGVIFKRTIINFKRKNNGKRIRKINTKQDQKA